MDSGHHTKNDISLSVYQYLFNRHSKSYADISDLNCDENVCSLRYQNSTTTDLVTFSRSDLKSADTVRHDGTDIVDVTGMKRKKANKIGYTVQLKLMQPPEEGSRLKIPSTILLYPNDIGRGSARSSVKKISEYIDRDVDVLSLRSGSGWTSFGICCVILGFFSFIASFVFGQFSDPEPKRLRKIR